MHSMHQVPGALAIHPPAVYVQGVLKERFLDARAFSLAVAFMLHSYWLTQYLLQQNILEDSR